MGRTKGKIIVCYIVSSARYLITGPLGYIQKCVSIPAMDDPVKEIL